MKKLSLLYGILTTAAFLVLTAFTDVEGPEINVKNGGDIVDGGTYNYGSVNANSSKSVQFWIKNLGSSNLHLGPTLKKSNLLKPELQDYLNLSGPHADQFRVIKQPTSPIGQNDSTDFIIAFEPTTPGAKMAAISIDNNDVDENPYDIFLNGTGHNTQPTISEIPNQTTPEDTPTPPIPFTVDDAEQSPFDLVVNAKSNNIALIPNMNIVLGGYGTNRTITLTPSPNAYGVATIVVSVSDGIADPDVIILSKNQTLQTMDYTQTTFVVEVTPVNDAPYFLAPLPPIALVQGQHYGIPITMLYLLVDDIDNADAELIWSIETNPILSPTVTADSILFDAPTDWFGTDTLTVTVSDGELSDSEELIVTVIEATSAVGTTSDLPETFHLSQNYPNPFNPTTTISYSLPKASHVNLTMYSMTGQSIQILIDEVKNAGYHTVQWDASVLGSGIYFYRIQAGDFTMVKKCTLMK